MTVPSTFKLNNGKEIPAVGLGTVSDAVTQKHSTLEDQEPS